MNTTKSSTAIGEWQLIVALFVGIVIVFALLTQAVDGLAAAQSGPVTDLTQTAAEKEAAAYQSPDPITCITYADDPTKC